MGRCVGCPAGRCILVGLAVLLVGVLLGFSARAGVAAPAKRCKASQVTLKIGARRTCVPRSRFRPTQAPPATTGTAFSQVLSQGIVLRRKGSGARVVKRPMPPALARRVLAASAALEQAIRTAVRTRSTASRTRRLHADPAITVSQDANGSITASASQTVSSAAGSATIKVAGTQPPSGDVAVDAELSAILSGGSKVTTGITTQSGGSGNDTCPSSDGVIRLNSRSRTTIRHSETFREGAVNLGSAQSGGTITTSTTATASLDDQAHLKPFPFTVTTSTDLTRTAQFLAFFGYHQRLVGTGSMSGTLHPSGAVTGATVNMNVSVTGVGGADLATLRATVQANVEKALRDEVASALEAAKLAESNAQGGKCTVLILSPTPPADLATGATASFTSRLETRASTAIQEVAWTATPAKGTVSPATAKSANQTWSVTAADTGPETARITVRGVSKAGISTRDWVGQLAFPPSYSGSVSAVVPNGPFTDTWSGTGIWVRSGDVTPLQGGGSAASYTLQTASVVQFSTAGACSGSSAAPGGTLNFGSLEIQIDGSGAWSSAFVFDVTATTPYTVTCGQPPTTIPYTPKAFLNSRQAGGVLRPMPPAGPITATAVPATNATSATWNLQPGT